MRPRSGPDSAASAQPSGRGVSRRDVLAYGAGLVTAGGVLLSTREKHHGNGHGSNGHAGGHLGDKEKKAFMEKYAEAYDDLRKVADGRKSTDVYDTEEITEAIKLRILIMLCSDERNNPLRAAELAPHQHHSRAEILLRKHGANGVPLAGSGVLVEGAELEDMRTKLIGYTNDVKQEHELNDDEEAMLISRHDGCGACKMKAEQLGDASRADALSWETAEKMRGLLGVKRKPLSIGYAADSDMQMRFVPEGHLVLGATVTQTPHFRGSEMGLPPMFAINGGFGKKNTDRELGALFGIAKGDHGFGEDWMAKYPFMVAVQATTDDGIEELHEMVKPKVKDFGKLARIVHLKTPRA